MDGQRFDEIMRALGTEVSRRRGLLAALGALATAAVGRDAAAAPSAECKPNRMECRGPGECCSGSCRNGWCAPRAGGGGKGKNKGGGNNKDGGKGGGKPSPKPAVCGGEGQACCDGETCNGRGLWCEGDPGQKTCQANVCGVTCTTADNFCNVPPANQCCGGSNKCRCMTTDDGPFCFGGAGYGGCEGTMAQGKQVPHCESNADCEAVFGADSGVKCISASTFPAGSSCCPGGNQSACILPCPKG